MLVSNLQQFIRLLVPPLTAAGINATAEKSVSGSLEALAAALEPFKDASTDQLAELLRVAHEYRQTGQIPEWASGKKPVSAKSRPSKGAKITPAEAVTQLRDLQQRSSDLDPAEIARGVQALAGLTVKDLQTVQKEFLGATIGKKKDELLAALQKRIDDFRESRDRVDGIRVR
jgi:hypothetical protein